MGDWRTAPLHNFQRFIASILSATANCNFCIYLYSIVFFSIFSSIRTLHRFISMHSKWNFRWASDRMEKKEMKSACAQIECVYYGIFFSISHRHRSTKMNKQMRKKNLPREKIRRSHWHRTTHTLYSGCQLQAKSGFQLFKFTNNFYSVFFVNFFFVRPFLVGLAAGNGEIRKRTKDKKGGTKMKIKKSWNELRDQKQKA